MVLAPMPTQLGCLSLPHAYASPPSDPRAAFHHRRPFITLTTGDVLGRPTSASSDAEP